MVDFNPKFASTERVAPEELPALDHGVGQQSYKHQLTPPQLLSLMAFKTPGSPDVFVLSGEHLVRLSGPVNGEPCSGACRTIFKAEFFSQEFSGNGQCLGEIYIRESTGTFGSGAFGTAAFGSSVSIFSQHVSDFITAIEHELISAALKRTDTFLLHQIESARWDDSRQDTLAHYGINVESLRLIMYETSCINQSELQEQRQALMKILVSDALTAALILELGGEKSIMHSFNTPVQTEQLVRCIIDAFLIARNGITDDSPVTLHELLQNKTTLALVGTFVQQLCRWNPLTIWASVLPKN